MLSAKNRLNLSKISIRKFSGKRYQSEEFVLLVRKSLVGFKAAVTVSKKVAPKAVDRNRIKRLITQSLTDKANMGIELIVIVKKNISELKLQEVKIKIDSLLKNYEQNS